MVWTQDTTYRYGVLIEHEQDIVPMFLALLKLRSEEPEAPFVMIDWKTQTVAVAEQTEETQNKPGTWKSVCRYVLVVFTGTSMV